METKCPECGQRLSSRELALRKTFCHECSKAEEEQAEADNMARRLQDMEQNLLHVSQSVPDRSYDRQRGTPGWLMGEPSPGRSF